MRRTVSFFLGFCGFVVTLETVAEVLPHNALSLSLTFFLYRSSLCVCLCRLIAFYYMISRYFNVSLLIRFVAASEAAFALNDNCFESNFVLLWGCRFSQGFIRLFRKTYRKRDNLLLTMFSKQMQQRVWGKGTAWRYWTWAALRCAELSRAELCRS